MPLAFRNRLDIPVNSTFTAEFSATENPASDGGVWRQGLVHGLDWCNLRTVSGRCYGTQTGASATIYDDSVALLPGLWAANHRVMATVFVEDDAGNWNRELELWLRGSITAHRIIGYECNIRVKTGATAYGEIIRWNGAIGNYTPLKHTDDAAFALSTGDTMWADAVGSVLTIYRNGVAIVTYDTSTGNDGGTGGNPGGPDSIVYTSGNPGLGHFLHDFDTVADATRCAKYGFTAFTAVEL
jgi:hypothetical protein